jgi:hypothetical protein
MDLCELGLQVGPSVEYLEQSDKWRGRLSDCLFMGLSTLEVDLTGVDFGFDVFGEWFINSVFAY